MLNTFNFLFLFYIWRGEGRERGRKALIGCFPYAPWLGTEPVAQESNRRPFNLWEDAQPTELHQPGVLNLFKVFIGHSDIFFCEVSVK